MTLNQMMIFGTNGLYITVKDMWVGGLPLPVYTTANLQEYWTVDITGRMQTVEGVRVLVAESIGLYTDSSGCPAMVPLKTPVYSPFWPYKESIPTTVPSPPILPPGQQRMLTRQDNTLTAAAGTIADAKLSGGSVELTGKVVTAVFRATGSNEISFFYIQEKDSPCGIKVVPPTAASIDVGDLVDVEGSAVSSDGTNAECYVEAESVAYVGSSVVPKPLGMSGKATAGGDFGSQSALNIDSSTVGSGVNPVGARVKVWGHVTWSGEESGREVYYIDDGSGIAQDGQSGLKVVCWETKSQVTQLASSYISATGILGAEMSEDDPPVPIPVVLVPCTTRGTAYYVSNTGQNSNNGLGWATAKQTVQAAINSASPGEEVWVKAGTYL